MADTQILVTLDTADSLEAQILVEYLAAEDPARFLKACLKLGFVTALQAPPASPRPKTLEELERSEGFQ
jgi:hypothetical protein